MPSLRTPLLGCATLTLFLLHTCLSFLYLSHGADASQLHHRPLFARHSKHHLLARQNANTTDETTTIAARRVSSIIDGLATTKNIASWLTSLGADGKWPESEVDLTTGCDARRANWPAQDHWQRIVVMAGAWHGGPANSQQWYQSAELLNATRLAMGYWFSRDFTNDACLDSGGKDACPCDNLENSLWNTNWFSNVILIPELVGETCMLLDSVLTEEELSHCGHMTTRSYATFDRAKRPGFLAGANVLDIGKIGVDGALLTGNYTMLVDAYRNIHSELTIRDEAKADGIRPDGSFGQHLGVLYNGNYGKDYSNAVLDLEIAAAGTQLEATGASRSALETQFEGNKWMVFANVLTGVVHWDFSAIGRMITFPVADNQASASLKTNLTTVLTLGNLWSSETLKSYVYSLEGKQATVNAGNKVGNKMFFANDYMVHRGPNYVSTLKMYSNRTLNTECVNSQNTKGFHLGSGTQYTYIQGNEYEDIAASWDWNLIPGITTDYQNTPLACDTTEQTGLEPFVGGVSDGTSGISVMRYTNPITQALQYQKAWFFSGSGVEHVIVNVLNSTSDKPIYTVLDQKRRSGETKAEGVLKSTDDKTSWTYGLPTSLWHADVGYTFPADTDATLVLRKGEATGNWLDIGTSTKPPTTVDLWAAWLEHSELDSPVEYTIWPGIGQSDFEGKRSQPPIKTIENSKDISAVHIRDDDTLMLVFWNEQGGSVTFCEFDFPPTAPLTVSSPAAITVMVSLKDGTVVASDPAQTLDETVVTFELGPGAAPQFWKGGKRTKTVNLAFPEGELAGSSVTADL